MHPGLCLPVLLGRRRLSARAAPARYPVIGQMVDGPPESNLESVDEAMDGAESAMNRGTFSTRLWNQSVGGGSGGNWCGAPDTRRVRTLGTQPAAHGP